MEAIELFQAHFDTLFKLTTNLSNSINDNHIINELQSLLDHLTKYQSEFEQSVLYYNVDNYQEQFEESNQRMCFICS